MTTNLRVSPGRWAATVTVLAVVGLFGRGDDPLAAAQAWAFHLEWECPDSIGTQFRLCVDGSCQSLPAVPSGGSAWRAPLPALPEGEHRLVVEACRGSECVAGKPDLVVRVMPGTARQPPIDVVSGPRIPLPRR